MATVNPKHIAQLNFLVVDRQDYVISAHQHPDAAERFMNASARSDLRVAELPRGTKLTLVES